MLDVGESGIALHDQLVADGSECRSELATDDGRSRVELDRLLAIDQSVDPPRSVFDS